MQDAPASDTAMKFADYVLENYIASDAKFAPTLLAKPPDLCSPLVLASPSFPLDLVYFNCMLFSLQRP